MKKLLLQYRTPLFFAVLFTAILVLFRKAFTIDFFLDDYFFLKVGKADSLTEFLMFFYPVKDYFYRPIPTELFYFIIHLSGNNLFIAHSIVFATYFTGLVFLFKVLSFFWKKSLVPYVAVVLYALHFTHVFQLYQLATFIEICLWASLTISLWFYLQKKHVLSLLFFVCALMSKETAVLFPLFLVALELIRNWKEVSLKKQKALKLFTPVAWHVILAGVFTAIYTFGVSNVTTIDIYKIQPYPRLVVNNLMWYTMWAMGFPNFLSDYMVSIFALPLPDFWNYLKVPQFRMYFYGLLVYYTVLLGGIFALLLTEVKERRKIIVLFLFCLFMFILFVSPTLPIIHRWMVRLTVPLVFVTLFQAYILVQLWKRDSFMRVTGIFLFGLFLMWNAFAIKTHETSSLYLLESGVTQNVQQYIRSHERAISEAQVVYFSDQKANDWGGSKKLKVTLHDTSFADHMLPGQKKKIMYAVDGKPIPKNAFVIESADMFKGL